MAGAVMSTPDLFGHERWCPLPADARYEISSLGRVRTFIAAQGRSLSTEPCVMRQVAMKHGYLTVSLAVGTKRVHRLVLEAFVGPCPPGHEGAHLDGDKANNTLANLAWVSHVENVSHKERHGTSQRGESIGTSKLTADDVSRIRERAAKGDGFRDIADDVGVTKENIAHIVNRRTWRHV